MIEMSSDSDVTLEPDPKDWESRSSDFSPKKSVLSVSLTHRQSKSHELSESDDDTQEYYTEEDLNKDKKIVHIKSSSSTSPGTLKHKKSSDKDTKKHDATNDVNSSAKVSLLRKQSTKVLRDDESKVKCKKENSKFHDLFGSDDDDDDDVEVTKRSTSKSLESSTKRSPGHETLKRKRSSNEEKGSQSQKPLCKYGSKCYRKNPSHLAEFRHSQKAEDNNEKPSTSSTSNKSSPPAKKMKVADRPTSDSPIAVFEHAQPISFFLTRVHGIPNDYNHSYTMDLKSILSASMGNLMASCQFNYMFEIPWLIQQYPPVFRQKPLLCVHGFKGGNKASMEAEAAKLPNIRFCQARLDMPYGTHHTKMMFLLYDAGMRVVIHTSNLIQNDWFQKTQGMWISPVFPKLPNPSTSAGDSPTHFKRDLLEYVAAYKAYQLKEWQDHIMRHDFSTASVFIIGSVPGRHMGDKKHCFGHMKLRKTLCDKGPAKDQVKCWPVTGQFSSIGTLGPTKESWLCVEFLQSLATVKGTSSVPLSSIPLKLIFPSKDSVRTSYEGFPAGGSIPYSINVAKKQPYLHTFFHKWKAMGRHRSRAMPHIKSYSRPSPSWDEVAWFIVTSANLSKAAWGALEKNGTQLTIRSYEIGVLFLPKFLNGKATLPCTSQITGDHEKNTLMLPYDFPLIPYHRGERPWIWDIPYKDLPDTNGNMWCPS